MVYSLWQADNGVIVHDWNLENYRELIGLRDVRDAHGRTLMTAVGAAALATLIAYPLAYFVVRKLGRPADGRAARARAALGQLPRARLRLEDHPRRHAAC